MYVLHVFVFYVCTYVMYACICGMRGTYVCMYVGCVYNVCMFIIYVC